MQGHQNFEDRESEEDIKPSQLGQRDLISAVWYSLVAVKRDVADIKREAKETNGRVTRLEKFMWLSMGVALAAVTAASSVAALIGLGKP